MPKTSTKLYAHEFGFRSESFCLRPVERYDVVPFLIQSQNNALFFAIFSTKKTGGKYIGEREMEVKENDISHDIRKQNFFFTLPFSWSPI
jgi:hypothetical protein